MWTAHRPRVRARPRVPLSGRCFLRRVGHAQGECRPGAPATAVEYLPLTAATTCASPLVSAPRVDAEPSVPSRSALPPGLMGNRYYEQRFRPCDAGATVPPRQRRFDCGDVIVQAVCSTTPSALRARPVVDVTGLQTSFLDATERDRRALLTVDEAVMNMHLYDGSEVPAVGRGSVTTGRLSVFAAYTPTEQTATALTDAGLRRRLVPVENAVALLLRRRGSLQYASHEQSVQLAHVVAENCAVLAASKALVLRLIWREGKVVALRVEPSG